MRKLVLTVFICLSIGFIGCKKDRDKNHLVNGNIDPTGIWIESYFELTEAGIKHTFDTMQLPCMANNRFNIKADGTATDYYVGTDSCVVYRAGNEIVQIGNPGNPHDFTWTQSGDTLTFVYHNSPSSPPESGQAILSKSGTTYQLTWPDYSIYVK
jgi:hypothetical protein